MYLDAAETHQQQTMVMENMARHERRYGELDTTSVLQIIAGIIPRTPRGSVVSNALTDALMAIEADIDLHMKTGQQ